MQQPVHFELLQSESKGEVMLVVIKAWRLTKLCRWKSHVGLESLQLCGSLSLVALRATRRHALGSSFSATEAGHRWLRSLLQLQAFGR